MTKNQSNQHQLVNLKRSQTEKEEVGVTGVSGGVYEDTLL